MQHNNPTRKDFMKKFFWIGIFVFLLFSCVSQTTKTKKGLKVAPQAAFTVWTKAYVLKDNVSLHTGPGKHFSIVSYLNDGDLVHIISNKHGWYQIITDKNQKGWVASNVVGPRTLSKTVMAAAFNDSIMNHFEAKLYIDKNHPYQVIYLETNEQNVSKAKKLARIVGKAYQKKVYPGKLTVNLIRPHQKKYFAQITLKARGLARIPIPIIEYGYLQKIKVKGHTVRLVVRVPNKLGSKALLKLARKISSAYSYPFTKSEIIVRLFNSQQGSKHCLLYYVEDAYGEDYAFGRCRL